MIDQQKLETQIAEYPVCEYAFIKPEEITFLEQVRHICESECPRYGTSWSCRLQWVLWQNVRNDAASIRRLYFHNGGGSIRYRKYERNAGYQKGSRGDHKTDPGAGGTAMFENVDPLDGVLRYL